MWEYSALWSKMFKETGFIFHISREYFKPVKLVRKIIYILFFKNCISMFQNCIFIYFVFLTFGEYS